MPGRLPMAFAAVLVLGLAGAPGARAEDAKLDFDVFKSKVEPIFLKKREGHVRCYVCHSENNNRFHLQKLDAGAKFWTDEESKKNFNSVTTLVDASNPGDSRFLMQPLAPEAGGNTFHSGGRQFANKNDPDWKVLAAWVSGQKADAGGKKKKK